MLKTPAFIIDGPQLIRKCQQLSDLAQKADVTLLYSIKAMSFLPILKMIINYVDGFATSSLFEAKLAQMALLPSKILHNFSVAYSPDEMKEWIGMEPAPHLIFNSLGQLSCLHSCLDKDNWPRPNTGLRVNPGISSFIDERYDPCRKNSKLGVPVNRLKKPSPHDRQLFKLISGLHFHATCESRDFSYLARIVKILDQEIPHVLESIQWINLGGGHLFDHPLSHEQSEQFLETVSFLQTKYGLKVIMEPGTDFVQNNVQLRSTILDILDFQDFQDIQENGKNGDGMPIAILDASVNHLPESYEYQDPPDILEGSHPEEHPYQYLLGGRSCLAGDVFGAYGVSRPLKISDTITFTGIGAYSLVKANRFNGINLPNIYLKDASDRCHLLREYSFTEYVQFFQSRPNL